MNTPHDSLDSAATFDPYGERLAEGVACASWSTIAGDRLARRVGGVVFWSLALAIVAGRIYAYHLVDVQAVVAAAAQVVALR